LARDRLAVVIATVGGIGYAPVAPGTVASAVTALALWIIPFSPLTLAVWLMAVIAVGTWAAHVAEPQLGGHDPGAIVVDEVAGMIVSVVCLPLTPAVLFAGFVLFRIFDVVKPAPARVSQRLPGGIGVMVDDLIAGVYALIVLVASHVIFGWP
jgi:phosphatidylglycerophosphatase A